MPMYTIRLASSSDGRSGGGPILTPSTCVTPLAAAMRSSEARSPAAMREPAGARRGAGVNAEAAIDSIIIFGLGRGFATTAFSQKKRILGQRTSGPVSLVLTGALGSGA
eukprot:scaffold22998_cov66-Phaeocystis_antarctica.AAC.2